MKEAAQTVNVCPTCHLRSCNKQQHLELYEIQRRDKILGLGVDPQVCFSAYHARCVLITGREC